jgi:hypothetical protein
MMAKTTKKRMSKSTKKPMRKTATKLPPALKAIENMVFDTANLDVHIKQVTERLKADGIGADIGYVTLAGRYSDGSNYVWLAVSSGGFGSPWPEWAYGIAERALHFNKRLLVAYNNQPFGNNLLQVACLIEKAPVF